MEHIDISIKSNDIEDSPSHSLLLKDLYGPWQIALIDPQSYGITRHQGSVKVTYQAFEL